MDHCFTADTLITTINGAKRIADIERGDIVLTSQGWKNVLEKWDNGEKNVLRMSLIFSKFRIEIEATPDHLFKTDKGWKQLQSLREGDKLFLQSDLMEGFTESTKEQSITPAINGNYTEMYGCSTMDLFRRDIKSIIRTLIQTTMRLKTLFVCLLKNIGASTASMTENLEGTNSGKQTAIKSDTLHQNGTKAMKVGNGTANTRRGKFVKNMILSALSAVSNIHQRVLSQSIVQTPVMQEQEGQAGLTMKREHALFVKNCSRRTDIVNNDSVVCLAVQSIEEVSRSKQRVYDLTVADCHEYFANGVLAHNCMDASNYLCVTHLRRLGIVNDDDMR